MSMAIRTDWSGVDLNPRPDLQGDASKWAMLLRLAHENNEQFYGVLHGIRAGGTILKEAKTASGIKRWILHPIIDPSGNKGWASQDEYNEAREKFLMPYKQELSELLSQLYVRWPFSG